MLGCRRSRTSIKKRKKRNTGLGEKSNEEWGKRYYRQRRRRQAVTQKGIPARNA